MSSTYGLRNCPVCGYEGAHEDLETQTGEQEISSARGGFFYSSERVEEHGVILWKTVELRPASKEDFMLARAGNEGPDRLVWNEREFGTLDTFKSDAQIAREFGAVDVQAYEEKFERPVQKLNPHVFDEEI